MPSSVQLRIVGDTPTRDKYRCLQNHMDYFFPFNFYQSISPNHIWKRGVKNSYPVISATAKDVSLCIKWLEGIKTL